VVVDLGRVPAGGVDAREGGASGGVCSPSSSRGREWRSAVCSAVGGGARSSSAPSIGEADVDFGRGAVVAFTCVGRIDDVCSLGAEAGNGVGGRGCRIAVCSAVGGGATVRWNGGGCSAVIGGGTLGGDRRRCSSGLDRRSPNTGVGGCDGLVSSPASSDPNNDSAGRELRRGGSAARCGRSVTCGNPSGGVTNVSGGTSKGLGTSGGSFGLMSTL